MSNSASTRCEIAHTILNQFGGGQFGLLVGIKNIMALESGVQFKIGRGAAKKINTVVVELTPADTYTVTFWNCRGMKMDKISTFEDVYCDELQDLFTRETGFYCRF